MDSNPHRRRKHQLRIAKGMCIRCGKIRPRFGGTTCGKCADRERQRKHDAHQALEVGDRVQGIDFEGYGHVTKVALGDVKVRLDGDERWCSTVRVWYTPDPAAIALRCAAVRKQALTERKGSEYIRVMSDDREPRIVSLAAFRAAVRDAS
jgi:hypothetical protein